jgi:hypothetical protein
VSTFTHEIPLEFNFPNIDLLASYEVSAQISAIEDMIAQGASMQTIVRLLCLASITSGGIKAKSLDSVKRELLQVISLGFARAYCEAHNSSYRLTGTITSPCFSR